MPKVKNNKSAEYWRSRYKYIEEKMYSIGEKTSNEIKSIYDYTLANIEKDIAVWYQRFANNNGISYNEALQLMKSKELDELKWDVFEYIKKGEGNEVTHLWDHELENASAQFHINRLEALKIQLLSHCDKTFGKVDKKIEKALKEAYSEGYLRTAYELQKGLEIGFDVAGIDNKLLNTIIHKPWADDGSNFSERIWGKYRPTLVNRLHKTLTDCIIRGDNPNNLAEGIAKEFNASRSSASNLVMTEYAYFTSLSRQDCLKELDVEEFEVVETLDTHTCAICQEMDSKHYPMSQYIIGVTAPPFHPRCRGTTCPYLNDEFTIDETRAARNPITGKTVNVKDMSYKEWKDEFVKEHGQAEWDYYEKSSKNKKQDKEQFERYKAILEDNIPKTLAEFQRIKYNDSEKWEDIKYYYRNIGERPFEYVAIDREIEKLGIINRGKDYPIEKVEINEWSKHSEDRLKERGITKLEAISYKDNAIIMLKKYPYPNTQNNYYCDEGMIGIRINDGKVCTVYSKKDFKTDTLKILEVAKKWLK